MRVLEKLGVEFSELFNKWMGGGLELAEGDGFFVTFQ